MSIDFVACWRQNASGEPVVNVTFFGDDGRQAFACRDFAPNEQVMYNVSADSMANAHEGMIRRSGVIPAAGRLVLVKT